MIAREPEKGTNRTVAVELLAILNVGVFPVLARSEERRVGKEC